MKYFASTAVIATAIVYVSKKIFDTFITSYLEKKKKIISIDIENDISRKKEIKKWTNPVLSSINGLNGRLKHTIEENGYQELNENHANYNYYNTSTLYYFAQYLCWIQILKEEIDYEIFDENNIEAKFFQSIKNVNKKLRDYSDIEFDKRNNPIYSLQQREIAESMRIEDSNCMSYYTFNKKIKDDAEFKETILPLQELIKNIESDSEKFKRLESTYNALEKLKKEAENILKNQAC